MFRRKSQKTLTFINRHLLPSYYTLIPYNNPEVNVTAPFTEEEVEIQGS